MRRHSEYEVMVAAYDGLSPAERRELDAHLAECAGCAAVLAEYRQLDTEIRSARSVRASAGLRVRFSAATAEAIVAPARKAVPIRLGPREPKVTKHRARPVLSPVMRFGLPVAGVLLFVAAIVVTLQLEQPRLPGSDFRPAVAPPQQAEIVKLAFTCDLAAVSGNYGAWAKLIAAYQEANPDIEVEIKSLPVAGTDEASYRQAVADLAAKTDVFCAHPLPSDWQRGVVANLRRYIASDPEFNPGDFYPNMLHTGDQGEVLSVPTYFKPMFMQYNPELFDKAGVPYPRPGWSWDEFLAAAKALTVRDGNTVTQWGYYGIGGSVFSARLLSGLNADLQTLPDYATAGEILNWYEKLYVDEPGAPAQPAVGLMGGGKVETRSFDAMLNNGQVAMSDIDLRLDRARPRHLAPYPDTGHGVLTSRYSDLVMSGKTAHPDEAWRLLSYLSRHLPDGEAPARRSLVEQASFWKRLDEASVGAYRYALEHLTTQSFAPLPKDYQDYTEAAIAVAKGQKTAEQALADLDAQVKLRGGPTERAANAEKAAGGN